METSGSWEGGCCMAWDAPPTVAPEGAVQPGKNCRAHKGTPSLALPAGPSGPLHYANMSSSSDHSSKVKHLHF